MSAAAPVLIDSSAWIEVLRNRAAEGLSRKVATALAGGTAAMTEPVWLELWQGVRGRKELARLQSLRAICRWLPFDAACWERAHAIARACSLKGASVPFGDVLVAACARHHQAQLLEHDHHFRLIQQAMS
jgi:predicted nucleic acid-binding protein